MEKMIKEFRMSMTETRKTGVIARGGLLIAFSVVLSLFKVPLGPTLQISFASLPIAAGGMLFGPFVGGIIGFVSDILGFVVRPVGIFFPGFTLNAVFIGMAFGFFFYRKKITMPKVILSALWNTLFINLGLTTLWLSIMFSDAYIVLLGARLVKNVLEFPVYASLLFMTLKLTDRLRKKIK